MPYVTEEVWSWSFAGEDRTKSVHTSAMADDWRVRNGAAA